LADESIASSSGFAEGNRFRHEAIAVGGFGDEGKHFRDVEGLEDVIVGAEFGCFDGGLGGAVGGDEYDGETGASGVKLLDEFEAVESGQAEVGDDDVEMGLGSASEAIVTAVFDDDIVAFAGEDALEGVANAWIVLD
jgi:hypothetical protein